MPLDLSYLLRVYAKKFSAALNNRIRRKLGLDDEPYSPLEVTTYLGQTVGRTKTVNKRLGAVKFTKEKKSFAGKRSPNSRLNHTGRLREAAFIGTSDDFSLTVEANPASYDGQVTYKQIVEWNSRDSGRTNKHIQHPPLIFPQTQEQIEALEVYQQFEKDLEQAIQLQLGDQLSKELPQDVEIRIG